MANIALRVITVMILVPSIIEAQKYNCQRFAGDLQNDELALQDIKAVLIERPQTQFDLR